VTYKHQIQLLELQARLASALGQLQEVIKCTICGVPITGPSQREHQVDCPMARELNVLPPKQVDCAMARELNVLPPKSEPKNETSMDFSFGTKPKTELAKPRKKIPASRKSKSATRIVNKTGDQFRDANGNFDRSAWAKDKAAKRRAEGKTLFGGKEKKLMGLPGSIGGLGA
jgi:hypothetical protein